MPPDDEFMQNADIIEIYRIYIDYIRHENELIHQRAGRFIGIQAALIATVGLVLQKFFEVFATHSNLSNDDVNPVYIFLLFVSIIGCVSSVSAYTSLSAARKSQSATYEAYHDLPPYDIDARGYGVAANRLRLPKLLGGGAEINRPVIAGADRGGGTFLVYLPITLFILWLFTGLAILYVIGLRIVLIRHSP